MSRLITIEGPGGSGKTTLGYNLQEVLPNSVCYDLDDFIDPVNSRDVSDKIRLERIGKSLLCAYMTIEQSLSNGNDVIIPFWSFKSSNVQGFAPRLDSLQDNHKRIRFMLESPLERCIKGDSSRNKNKGVGHITKVWEETYKRVDSGHILIPNEDYRAQERIKSHLECLH